MKNFIFICLFSVMSPAVYSGDLGDSLNCGNATCEYNLGETQESCPLDCGTSKIASYNFETICPDTRLFSPKSSEELLSLLSSINQSTNSSLRFIGNRHSTNSLICGKGNLVLTEKFNHIIGIQKKNGEDVVEVETGVNLGELSDYLDSKNYSLGFAYPAYRKLTIGGLLATGSHGSSRIHPAISSQMIREVTLITVDGKSLVFDTTTPKYFKAIKVHLGLLGFIHKIKLKIEPQFNLELKTIPMEDETNLLSPGGILNWGATCDYEAIAWFPFHNKGVKFCGNKTSKAAMPGAENITLGAGGQQNLGDDIVKYALHYSKKMESLGTTVESLRYKGLVKNPPFVYKNGNKDVSSHIIVGPSNKILLSRLVELNGSYSNDDFSFAFPESQAVEVLRDIRRFAQINHYGFPMTGFYMRFGQSDGESFLSHIERSPGEKKLYVLAEFIEYKYFNLDPEIESKQQVARNKLLSLLINKYNVSFHWGKNSNNLFLKSNVQNLYNENLRKFIDIADLLDPKGVLRNEFIEKLIY